MHAAPIRSWKVDSLKVEVYPSREEMGKAAGTAVARKIRELQREKANVAIVFGSAPSQNEMLDALCREEGIDWSRITAFHMDEYIGLPPEAPQRFSKYLIDRLVSRVRPGVFHAIDDGGDPESACAAYAELLGRQPIDIVCLGIGENGHIAFNDPHVALFNDPKTVKVVELDEVCRQQQVNDGCFANIHDVPARAITLTVPALMSGAHLFCVVPGPTKKDAVERTLNGPISPECPASILRLHRDCTLYLDPASEGTQ